LSAAPPAKNTGSSSPTAAPGKGGADMITSTPASPSPAADRQSESEPKGTRHRRKGVDQQTGHELHRTHRHQSYRHVQHAVLDILIRAGTFHVSDLDELDLPDGVGRSVIGTGIKDLARSGLIRRAGPPAPTSAGGRHSNFLYTWTLAADLNAVDVWKDSHPIPDPDDDTL
jgi:hypothetical protein